jgi:hypothetical protein
MSIKRKKKSKQQKAKLVGTEKSRVGRARSNACVRSQICTLLNGDFEASHAFNLRCAELRQELVASYMHKQRSYPGIRGEEEKRGKGNLRKTQAHKPVIPLE